jgi:xylulokinase
MNPSPVRRSRQRAVSEPLYVGVDVGTSACKTVLLDRDGRLLETASATYSTRRTTAGEVSQDPRDWLRAAAATMRACARRAGSGRIAGVGVTAPAHVGVLLDDAGEPVTRALLCFDARSEPVARALRDSYGERFFETTFVELTSAWTFPQLAWLRRELGRKAWSGIRCLLLQKDYVRFRMTGELATDPSDAVGAALVDQRVQSWSEELCAEVGLPLEKLPPILPVDALAGRLTREWARRTGVPAGTPVAVGGTDTVSDLVSVNALRPGDSIVKIASTGSVVTVGNRPRPHRRLLTYPLGLPGLWYTAAATSTAATAYNWLRALLANRESVEPQSHRAVDAAVSRVPPGAGGVIFLPFLEGERVPYWDRSLRAAFLGLSSAHGQGHLVRAVMEGVALSLRDCLELMREVGHAVERPRFTGGGVASGVWRRILAGALGLDGYLAEPQGPAVGAALLAQAAAAGVTVRPRPRLRPVKAPDEWTALYDRLYCTYATAAHQVEGVSHELVELAGGA